MRILIAFSLLVCISCGGSLSSDQRKKIRANIEAQSLKKISDADLTEAALVYARGIYRVIESKNKTDQNLIDSLSSANDVQILFLKPGDSNLRGVERQVLEAYGNTGDSTGNDENLQRMGNDSLLYTKPILRRNQKDSPEFRQVLALRIHKKAVVLSIKN